MATIDAPVRVRARVSPSGRSTNGEPGRDLDLPGVQAGHLLGQVGETFHHARRAEDLGQRFGLLVGQAEHRTGLVRVGGGVDDDLEITCAPCDHTNSIAVVVVELVAQADSGQQDFLDLHGLHPPG